MNYQKLFAQYLKPRPKEWHKGLSGHVLIVGGEFGFSGAPHMAGEGALRVGAGLVTIATQPENAVVMNVCRPELMCHGIHSAKELEPLLAKANVIILGPGLGQTDWSKTLWKTVIQAHLPLVVDADALNLLAAEPQFHQYWVLTPHPGEAARLLNLSPTQVQADRLAAAENLQKRYGGVIVLKGVGTIIYDGKTDAVICDKGNPGMASAGMGDILSGVIGALMGQGIPLFEAATLGVYLHAMAGDLAAKQGERGMIATDLLPYLRELCNEDKFSEPLR